MSRSLLDERFRQVFGRSPIRYLTEWRMHIAEDLLATTDLTVSLVARRVGYDSEEAFSRAFKRSHDIAPSAWRADSNADGSAVTLSRFGTSWLCVRLGGSDTAQDLPGLGDALPADSAGALVEHPVGPGRCRREGAATAPLRFGALCLSSWSHHAPRVRQITSRPLRPVPASPPALALGRRCR